MTESVVDYNAWRNGYMPPTEHQLIDQLSYRGARVVTMSAVLSGCGFSWWLVVNGDVDRKKLVAISRHIHSMMDALDDDPTDPPDATPTPSTDTTSG